MQKGELKQLVNQWLLHAESDLAIASLRKTKSLRYEHLCFHAQQAAEKSIKAVLLASGATIQRTHDLAYLIDQLPTSIIVPSSLLLLPILTKYAVQLRYPGQEITAIMAKDRNKAVLLAHDTFTWSRTVINSIFST